MKKLIIVLSVGILAIGLAVAAEDSDAVTPTEPAAPEGCSALDEWTRLETDLEKGLIDAEQILEPVSSAPSCPFGGSCGTCRRGSDIVFCLPGSTTTQDTGLSACQLPNGGTLGCPGGKTIHVNVASCPKGACDTACSGSGLKTPANPVCQ